jgi:hypothetical protein
LAAAAAAVDAMIGVLDAPSVADVVEERASQGRCGNPHCVIGAPAGGRCDLDGDDQSDANASSSEAGTDNDGDDEDVDGSSQDDEEPDGIADDPDFMKQAAGGGSGGEKSRRSSAKSARTPYEVELRKAASRVRAGSMYCGPECRSAMRRAVVDAGRRSANDPVLVDRVLALFPALRAAYESVSGDALNRVPAVTIKEKDSRQDQLARQTADARAAHEKHNEALGIVQRGGIESGVAPVMVTRMSVAARALAVAFRRIGAQTVAVFNRNAPTHGPALVSAIDEAKPALELLPRVVAPLQAIIAGPSGDGAAADSAGSTTAGLKGIDKARVQELRRQFTAALCRELRRAALLLRLPLVENPDVMRVLNGVGRTLEVADLLLPEERLGTTGAIRCDPDSETCLLLLLALLTAAAVTDPTLRVMLLAADEPLRETIGAMHVTDGQFVRLTGQFFGL